MIKLNFECMNCHKVVSFEVKKQDLDNYKSGKLFIQAAFPYLTPGEREIMQSGICNECFDKMFREEQDYE